MGGSRQKGRGVLANLRLSPTVMHLSLVSLFKEKKGPRPAVEPLRSRHQRLHRIEADDDTLHTRLLS